MSDNNVTPIGKKPKMDRKMRRNIERLNNEIKKDPAKVAELSAKAREADKIIEAKRKYFTESQDFVAAQGQFLTTIINGFTSHHGSYNYELYEEHYELASKMAGNYVRRLNEYREERENNAPKLELDKEIQ